MYEYLNLYVFIYCFYDMYFDKLFYKINLFQYLLFEVFNILVVVLDEILFLIFIFSSIRYSFLKLNVIV